MHREVTGDCEVCHQEHKGAEADLRPLNRATFDHAAETGFALTARHGELAQACERCHTTRSFLGNRPACSSCHADAHGGTAGPDCTRCHTPAGFAVAQHEHKGLEAFFVGRHRTLECVQCHTRTTSSPPTSGTARSIGGPRFDLGLDRQCTTCHRDVHTGGNGDRCDSCHTPESWRTANRAFHKVTVFPLEGMHLGVPCNACHLKGETKGTPTRCHDCHWIRRQDDRYRTRLGTECQECHRPVSWTAVNWNHAARTGMALNAAHRMLACDSCHRNQEFAGARPECIACHRPDYDRAQNPRHAAAGFPSTCDLCHSPSSGTFAGARFNHGGFALVGVHATQPCASCHRSGTYQGTPRECIGCHQADYQRAQNPNHVAAAFPTTCESCHRPTDPSFSGGTFSHSSSFALQGGHASAPCGSCHRNNVFRGTPRECVACHQADYQRAQSPNHASAGFPTACESCHRTGGPGWRGASFNHAQVFALVGTHASQPCSACHQNNVYRGTPRDCAGCHLARYQATRTPNHVAAGFPTTCDACHRASDSSWNQGRFNHAAFPITSGRHAGSPCSACHTDPNNFRAFTCLTCHDRGRTDSKHQGRPGYRYDSQACYSCHPQGRDD